MELKDFISNVSFKFKNEIEILVSFNGQSLTCTSSVKEF